jgi:hypothetical protein
MCQLNATEHSDHLGHSHAHGLISSNLLIAQFILGSPVGLYQDVNNPLDGDTMLTFTVELWPSWCKRMQLIRNIPTSSKVISLPLAISFVRHNDWSILN